MVVNQPGGVQPPTQAPAQTVPPTTPVVTPPTTPETDAFDLSSVTAESLLSIPEEDFDKNFDQIVEHLNKPAAPADQTPPAADPTALPAADPTVTPPAADPTAPPATETPEQAEIRNYKEQLKRDYGTDDLTQVAQIREQQNQEAAVTKIWNEANEHWVTEGAKFENLWLKEKEKFATNLITKEQLEAEGARLKAGLDNLRAKTLEWRDGNINHIRGAVEQKSQLNQITNDFNGYITNLKANAKYTQPQKTIIEKIMGELHKETVEGHQYQNTNEVMQARERMVTDAYDAGYAAASAALGVQVKQQQRAENLGLGTLQGSTPPGGNGYSNLTKSAFEKIPEAELDKNYNEIMAAISANGGLLPD